MIHYMGQASAQNYYQQLIHMSLQLTKKRREDMYIRIQITIN